MKQFLRHAAAILALAGAGCTTVSEAPSSSTVAPSPGSHQSDEHATIADAAIMRSLTEKMDALKKAGKLTDSDKLQAQLSRKQHSLKLAAQPSTTPLTPVQLYERCEDGVLIFASLYNCGKCTRWHTNAASGFVIHSDGIAVTNYHVIENDSDSLLGAMTVDGRVLPIKEVLAADKAADVAIVRLDGKGLTALPVASNDPVGTPVVVISHPTQRFYTLTTGIISRYFNGGRHGQHAERMAITADYAKGSSGGPVINDYGAVTGIVSSTSSIYYNKKDGVESNLQMVIKSCVPGKAVLNLLSE
jgi:S1-C subfamily serine protease